MIIPIRCFSCGKPIGQLWDEYNQRSTKGEETKKILDDIGLERYCCRAQIQGHMEIIDTVAKFKKF